MINKMWLKSSLGLLASSVLLLLSLGPIVAQFNSVPGCFLEKTASKAAKKNNRPAGPDLRRLFERSIAGAVITEEQLAEEQAVEAEQVEQARIWLGDADPAQRVTGAEQLSAYPTPAAETYLLKALHDDSEQVRAAAANSLATFKQPTVKTYDALIQAMQDGNEDVRFNAWSTLSIYLNRVDFPSKTARRIQLKLAKLLKQGRFLGDIEVGVRDYLRDQQDR